MKPEPLICASSCCATHAPLRTWMTTCGWPDASDHQAPSTSVPSWWPSSDGSVIWGALLHGAGGAAPADTGIAASATAMAARNPKRYIGPPERLA
jgi:hypothetical protein